MPRNILDAVQGTLDTLILKRLSWGAMHGYAIGRAILQDSGEELLIEEGTLYPALHRLEDRGLLRSDWGITDLNRKAKFYELTAAGRRELRARTEDWERYSRAVSRVLNAEPAKG